MEKSYSALTRKELVKVKPSNKKQVLAELAAIALSAGNIHFGKNRFLLEISSETEEVAVRTAFLIKMLYSVESEIRAKEKTQPKKHTCFSLEVSPAKQEGKLLFDMGLLSGTPENYSFAEVKKEIFDGCFEAVLRGTFLGCGVLCDPNKEYRIEFVISNDFLAKTVFEGLEQANIGAKLMVRSERNVVYIKRMENISDVLILAGATGVMMEIENVRVYKEVKNSLNRTGNCFVGNMGKTLNAAQKQADDIKILLSAKVPLSDALREAAELRLENPDASLKQLEEISGISKSALNKRYIKIRELREEIR